MPWKVFKDGSQWCVHKLKDDGSKGEKVKGGCHSSKADADKHARALHSNVEGAVHIQQRQVTYEEIDGTDGLLSIVRDVEICAVGIEYPLASGPKTFTTDDLLAAIRSQDDPAVKAPRVWLGHPDDDRFHAGRATPAGTAEPALGTVVNMRVEDDGMTLVGDIAGCPTWLAKILASAYPSRSIEGFEGAQTVTGREWDVIITDLALLGVRWPGVSTIDDLKILYSEEGPDVEVEEAEPMSIAASASGRIQAQAELEKIRRAFVAQLTDLQIPGWPWIRSVLQDPNELIVDDDEGGLYRVPYDASGEEVTFGEVKQVQIKYVNASQARDPDTRGLLVNMLTRDSKVVASWGQRAESRPDSETQEANSVNPEIIKALRARLGLSEEQLPDDATEEQVQAILADGENPPPAPKPPTPTPGDTPSPDQVPGAPGPGSLETPAPEPVAASAALPEGMVAVPAEAWSQMQASVQDIAAARATEQEQADVRIVQDALRAGKIFPAQREYYEGKIKDTNTREAFRHLLTASVAEGGLAPGIVPLEARGQDPGGAEANQEAYPAEWLPELQQGNASPITVEA